MDGIRVWFITSGMYIRTGKLGSLEHRKFIGYRTSVAIYYLLLLWVIIASYTIKYDST